MTRMVPMPSPRGTNHEGFFVPENWVKPKALAYDAAPPGLSRRPTAAPRAASRDQESPDGLPDQITADFAVHVILEVLHRVSDGSPTDVLNIVQRALSRSDQNGGENNGNDYAPSVRAPARVGDAAGPKPFTGGPKPGGALDRQLAADRSMAALTKRHPDIAQMVARIRLGGY